MIFFNSFSIKKLFIKRVSWFSLYNFSFNYFSKFSYENLKLFFFLVSVIVSKKFAFYKKGFLFSNFFFQNFFYKLVKVNIYVIDSIMNTVIFNFFYNKKFNRRFFKLKKGFFLIRYHNILKKKKFKLILKKKKFLKLKDKFLIILKKKIKGKRKKNFYIPFNFKFSFFSGYLFRFFKLQNFLSSFKFFNHKRFLVFLNFYFFKVFRYFKVYFFFKKIRYLFIKDIFFFFKRVIFFKICLLSEKHLTAANLVRYFFFRLIYKEPIKVLLKNYFFKRLKKLVTGYRVFAKGRFSRKDRASDLFYQGGRMPASSAKYGNLEFASMIVKLKNSTCNLKVWLFKNKSVNKRITKILDGR